MAAGQLDGVTEELTAAQAGVAIEIFAVLEEFTTDHRCHHLLSNHDDEATKPCKTELADLLLCMRSSRPDVVSTRDHFLNILVYMYIYI